MLAWANDAIIIYSTVYGHHYPFHAGPRIVRTNRDKIMLIGARSASWVYMGSTCKILSTCISVCLEREFQIHACPKFYNWWHISNPHKDLSLYPNQHISSSTVIHHIHSLDSSLQKQYIRQLDMFRHVDLCLWIFEHADPASVTNKCYKMPI